MSLVLVLVVVGTAVLVVAAVLRAHAQAVTAADLAALAAAAAVQGGDSADAGCQQASRIAASNGARLVGCVVTGDIVDVVTEVPVRGLAGSAGPARAAARAGPVAA